MAADPDDRAFSAIFEHSIEAILLADDDGRYLRANPAAEALTGHSVEALRAMTVFELTPAADKQAGLPMWREFIRQGTLSGDSALTRKDGSVAEVSFRAVANIAPGIHLSIIRDLTAHNREARRVCCAERLQKATAAMNAAVDATTVAEAALSAGMEALKAQAGRLVAVVEDGRCAEIVATAGVASGLEAHWAEDLRSLGLPPKTVDGRDRFSLEAPSWLGEVFRRGDPIRVEQLVEAAPACAQAAGSQRGRAAVCLPLGVSGALIGGLYLFWDGTRLLREDETSFLATLTGLCAQALDRARLYSAERDARERAVASEKATLEYQKRLQRMAFDLFVAAERERRRLAAALHDGVSQYLAVAKMALDPVRQRVQEGDREAIGLAIDRIVDAIGETHSLSFELSPPVLYDLGIKAALCWLSERLEKSTGLRIEVSEDGLAAALDDVTASIVFRTVRELLMNSVKHAGRATARVSLHHHEDHLEVLVEDGGAGFEPAEPSAHAGFGLMSVREQIGQLGGAVEIESRRNEGTRVTVRVPIRAKIDA